MFFLYHFYNISNFSFPVLLFGFFYFLCRRNGLVSYLFAFTVSYFKNACSGSLVGGFSSLISGFEWKRLLGWRGVSNANFKALHSSV